MSSDVKLFSKHSSVVSAVFLVKLSKEILFLPQYNSVSPRIVVVSSDVISLPVQLSETSCLFCDTLSAPSLLVATFSVVSPFAALKSNSVSLLFEASNDTIAVQPLTSRAVRRLLLTLTSVSFLLFERSSAVRRLNEQFNFSRLVKYSIPASEVACGISPIISISVMFSASANEISLSESVSNFSTRYALKFTSGT